MTRQEIKDLIDHRQNQAYELRRRMLGARGSKADGLRRQWIMFQSACEIASAIYHEQATNEDTENRVKALFTHVICNKNVLR